MRSRAVLLCTLLVPLVVLAGCGHSDDGIHVRDDATPASSVPRDTDD